MTVHRVGRPFTGSGVGGVAERGHCEAMTNAMLSNILARAVLCLAFTLSGRPVHAQAAAPARRVTGVVQSSDARPIDGANVFIIETLEGAVTRDDGRFNIATAGTGPLTLIVRRLGFAEQRRTITERDSVALVIRLEPSGVALAPVSVQAGQYTASEERGATLT